MSQSADIPRRRSGVDQVFKLATFNCNSIRTRLDVVLKWLSAHNPDVLCLQETKVQDADFPRESLESAGWHVVFRGDKGYNGVAIVSRAAPKGVVFGFDDAPPDEARLVRAHFAGVDVLNAYVPQGQAVDSPAFTYKLEWFARVHRLLEKHFSPSKPLLWAGDLNVAPEAADVYDPKHLAGSVCFHPDEHAALKSALEWGLVDVFRLRNSEPGQFTFWDYRIPNSVKRNLGWRLDHILATKPLAAKSTRCYVDRQPRLAERASDHTFLVAEFDV